MGSSTLIIFGLGLLLLLFLMPVAEAIVTVIRKRIASTIPALQERARQVFRWAARVLTEDGTLSVVVTIEQVVGSIIQVMAGLVFAATALAVTLATLAPLLGIDVQPPQALAGIFDQLLGVSLVLLALVFGMVLSDLVSWSVCTRFLSITIARGAAFCIAATSFVLSLLVAVALAVYRVEVMQPESGSEAAAATLQWLHTLPPTFILLGLAALLFVGLAVALLHIGTLSRAVVASLAALGGLVCITLRLVLGVLDLCLEVVVAGLKTLPGAFATFTNVGQASMGRARDWLRAASGKLLTKLGRLVQPRPPRGPAYALHAPAESARPSSLPGAVNGQNRTPVALSKNRREEA